MTWKARSQNNAIPSDPVTTKEENVDVVLVNEPADSYYFRLRKWLVEGASSWKQLKARVNRNNQFWLSQLVFNVKLLQLAVNRMESKNCLCERLINNRSKQKGSFENDSFMQNELMITHKYFSIGKLW